jgi:hypothetical protein
MVIYLPEKYWKEAMCKTHDNCLEDTMPLKKPTLKFQPHTTSLKYFKPWNNTKKSASGVNREKN